jgi:chromatin segregation and condensation protein Rec8/ScpA/Scc1 (kleisin family)
VLLGLLLVRRGLGACVLAPLALELLDAFALLELLRRGRVSVRQVERFGPIKVEARR